MRRLGVIIVTDCGVRSVSAADKGFELETDTGKRRSDIVIIAVPTDFDPASGNFDCSAIETVIQGILNVRSSTPEAVPGLTNSDVAAGLTSLAETASAGTEALPEPYYRILEHIGKYFDSSISLKRTPSGKGTMTIRFGSDEEVDRFLKALDDANL